MELSRTHNLYIPDIAAKKVLDLICAFVSFLIHLQTICTSVHLINGGYQFDSRVITDVDEKEVLRCVKEVKAQNVKNVVISGVFSPVNSAQEQRVSLGKMFQM